MRLPARIEPWLSTEDLQVWVREAPDKSAYQRRLAIWLTGVCHLPAHRVAESLCVSKQAVWLWIAQYNQQGPEGLHCAGRGGRRWAWLSWEEEERFLEARQQAASRGQILTAPQLRAGLEKLTGRRVSLAYVYRLLHRHGWRKLGPRPPHPQAQPAVQKRFKKTPPAPPRSDTPAPSPGAGASAVSRRSPFRLHQRSAPLLGPGPLRPLVGHQIIREFVYGLAAVSPFDGELCSLVLPWVDTETRSLFLAHTAACLPNDHDLMLLDGAGWHTAAALQVPPTLHLLPLPPYSPELNPVEHLWDHLRENYIANHVFSSLDAVVDQLSAGLHYLHQHHEVVRSMTCFDWIKTLSLTFN